MEIYWFERDGQSNESLSQRLSQLKNHSFDGVMYPYGTTMGDYFTRVSRVVDPNENFKYIVSIRTYTISPQYLSMICSSINNIAKNKIHVNLLTGYINEYEKSLGGIISEINDYSSNVERSNYMLNYAKEFKKSSETKFFVSTTNKPVFDACTENEFSMILPYVVYKQNWLKLSGQKVVLVIAPVFESPDLVKWECDNANECRHPKDGTCMALDFFTKESFFSFLNECENKGIFAILLQESDYKKEQYAEILSCIKEYKDQKLSAIF